ncbi:MAG: polyprenyl synthetase family protein [Candidatus Hodarchaeales archaeon]|jgi:geranylgeranyl diphosphate synthase type I
MVQKHSGMGKTEAAGLASFFLSAIYQASISIRRNKKRRETRSLIKKMRVSQVGAPMSSDPLKLLAEKGQVVQEHLYRFLKIGTSKDFDEVVRWQVQAGGKRIRPALTMLFAEAIEEGRSQKSEVLAAAAAIELIHNFSLVFDDIIDRGDLRRGEKTTRAEYGDEMAVLAGLQHREAVYHAAKATGAANFPRVLQTFSEAISEMVEGERLDVLFEQKSRPFAYYAAHRYHQVTEEDYLEMINGKTASLIRAACIVGCIVGGGNDQQIEAAREYGYAAGLAFQIIDDYLDLLGDEKLGKPIGKDIIERKLGNYVLIKALQGLPSEKQELLLETIQADLPDDERVEKAMELINQTDGARLAKETALNHIEKAKTPLDASYLDSSAKSMLISIADYLVSRLY